MQLFARRVLNLTMVTVRAQDCYQLHRKLRYFPSRLIPHVDETNEDHQCDFQCKRPTTVIYLRSSKTEQNGNTMGQLFSYLQTSQKLRIRLGQRFCIIISISLVYPRNYLD